MDRRSFLGLLGGAAAALYVPRRSYFFGPWAPTQTSITVTEQHAGVIYPEWRNGELVTVIEEWSPETYRYAEIWDRDLLAAVRSRLVLRDAFEWEGDLWGVTDDGVYLARREADHISITNVKPLSELLDPMTVYPIWRNGELVSVEGNIETRSFALRDELTLAAARERV